MRKFPALAVAMTVLTVVPANAATKRDPTRPVEKITCREFVALDDVFKPQAVSLALGYDRAKHPEAEVVDVTGIDRVVPVIVTSCRARPRETLLQRVRAHLQKR